MQPLPLPLALGDPPARTDPPLPLSPTKPQSLTPRQISLLAQQSMSGGDGSGSAMEGISGVSITGSTTSTLHQIPHAYLARRMGAGQAARNALRVGGGNGRHPSFEDPRWGPPLAAPGGSVFVFGGREGRWGQRVMLLPVLSCCCCRTGAAAALMLLLGAAGSGWGCWRLRPPPAGSHHQQRPSQAGCQAGGALPTLGRQPILPRPA
jgi:hypothetical protein